MSVLKTVWRESGNNKFSVVELKKKKKRPCMMKWREKQWEEEITRNRLHASMLVSKRPMSDLHIALSVSEERKKRMATTNNSFFQQVITIH